MPTTTSNKSKSTNSKKTRSNSPATSTKSGDQMQPGPDLVDYLADYARQKPEVAALWCLGIGFVLGWKLKPW